ncbi:MAG TPA: hypothetical protein VJU59_15915 [Paraburkholderia sp.]|uniref:hypothetical protein n=1 Tax=Paraburkholderia sp. TaxID=1926495 RepID=UPI002B4A9377|nr:hypothetical protein [Paraburkholderia sp.]HKR41135.1 hypothetical protein [Paraburkholderia sp.]
MLPAINCIGFSPIEAYATHRSRLQAHAQRHHAHMLACIRLGGSASAAAMSQARAALASFNVFLMATVPIVPPVIAALEADPARSVATNALVLRIPRWRVSSTAARCRCRARRAARHLGLSVAGLAESDAHVLGVATAIESVLQSANAA